MSASTGDNGLSLQVCCATIEAGCGWNKNFHFPIDYLTGGDPPPSPDLRCNRVFRASEITNIRISSSLCRQLHLFLRYNFLSCLRSMLSLVFLVSICLNIVWQSWTSLQWSSVLHQFYQLFTFSPRTSTNTLQSHRSNHSFQSLSLLQMRNYSSCLTLFFYWTTLGLLSTSDPNIEITIYEGHYAFKHFFNRW